MGQSSSTQGQTSDSSYRSSQSGLTAAVTFRPEGARGKGGVGAEEGGEEEEEEEDREVRTLGPAGRYPDNTEGRPPSGARLTPQTVKVSRWIPFFPVARGLLCTSSLSFAGISSRLASVRLQQPQKTAHPFLPVLGSIFVRPNNGI